MSQAISSSASCGSKLRVSLQQHWSKLHDLIEHHKLPELPRVVDRSKTLCKRSRRCVCQDAHAKFILRIEMALCRAMQMWFQLENAVKAEALLGNLCLEVVLTWKDMRAVRVGHVTLLHNGTLPKPSFWLLEEVENASSDGMRFFRPKVLADGLPDVTSTHLFAMKLVEETGFPTQGPLGGTMAATVLKLQDSRAVVTSAQPSQLRATAWNLPGTLQVVASAASWPTRATFQPASTRAGPLSQRQRGFRCRRYKRESQ